MTRNQAPEIDYPAHFAVPGPATQADATLECMEWFLNDHLNTYTFFGSSDGLSPEQWVDFRSLYSNIHWMYTKLTEEDTPNVDPD